MNLELLKNSIEILKEIRSKLDGVADDSVLYQLDNVIIKLQADYEEGNCSINREELLYILGKFLTQLPLIYDLVEKLMK